MQHKKFLYLLVASILVLSAFLPILIRNVRAEPAPTLILIKSKGKVGEVISINGTIDTENGLYEIRFNGTVVESGTAIGNKVENFTVPNLPAGQYDVTLYDVNASSESQPAQFTIETAYILDIINEPEKPYQFLEGDNVTISVTIKGGKNGTTYSLNLTVTVYDEVSYNITKLKTDKYGYAVRNVTYPNDFLPLNFTGEVSTNYVGIYTVKLNETLAEPVNFTVGITDRREYHREEALIIHATGYQANETATVSVKFPDGSEIPPFNVTATSSGIIHYENGTILSKAPIGEYMVQINGTETIKKYPDIQNFTVPGFTVIIPVKNLNGEPVPEVTLEILENETGSHYETKTAENGDATIKLEKGSYTWRAIYKEKLVGEGNFTTHGGNETIDPPLEISLAALDVKVIIEGTSKTVPFAQIKLFCNYTTINNENKSLTLSNETNVNGIAEFKNVFINESYIVEAYKYDALFNCTTFSTEPEKPVYSLNVTYPAKTLIVTILDSANRTVQGMIVKAYEWTNGTSVPTDEGESDENGVVTLGLTFGWYRIRVFKPTEAGEILVNETKAELTIQNETVGMKIKCKLLGLNLTVRVIDILGSPIPNVTVRLELISTGLSFNETGSGEFFFNDVVGGRYKILVFLPNDDLPYLMDTVYLDKPNTVITLMDKDHINLFGILIGTYTFVMAIIIGIVAALIVIVVVFRRLSKRWISKEKV